MARHYEIKGFLESSFIDWPSRIASVLFLAGCNFRCPFCHNFGLVLDKDSYPTLDWIRVKTRIAGLAGWVDGVVITGGEPTLSPHLHDLIKEIKMMGLEVKLDTNGGRPEILEDLLEKNLLDHVAMDVKGPLDELSYARAAGRPGFLENVVKSLDILGSSKVPYTLRTTVVPELHSHSDILRLAGQLSDAPSWKLQKFNPENAMDCTYRQLDSWDDDAFERLTAKAMAVKAGAA